MNIYLLIHVKGRNLISYGKNHFFAQKRLLEQLCPISFEEYDFSNEDEITMLIVQPFYVHDETLRRIAISLCIFLNETQTVSEFYYTIHTSDTSMTVCDFDSIPDKVSIQIGNTSPKIASSKDIF